LDFVFLHQERGHKKSRPFGRLSISPARIRPTFGNILLPHSGPGFSPAAALHGGFSFGGLNPSNPRIYDNMFNLSLK
jgi:hypothetical protein